MDHGNVLMNYLQTQNRLQTLNMWSTYVDFQEPLREPLRGPRTHG